MALRTLVHAPRLLSIRAFTRCIPHRHLSFAVHSAHDDAPSRSATPRPSPRNAAIFEDVSAEYSTQVPQDANRRLQKLVATGQYTTAVSVLVDSRDAGIEIEPSGIYISAAQDALQHHRDQDFTTWLQLLPDIQIRHLDFSAIIRILLLYPEANMPLIISIGHIIAAKGYVDVVRTRILPILVRHMDGASLTGFMRTIETEAGRYTRQLKQSGLGTKSAASTSFFEVPDEGPCLDKKFFSSQHVNTSVFEESAEHLITDELSAIPPTSPIEILEDLVSRNDFESAGRVLDDMRELGEQIPPSLLYAAVEAILRNPTTHRAVQLFSQWFSLLPRNMLDSSRIVDIAHVLLTAPIANMPLILQFGIMTTEKGHQDIVEERIIPIVVRLTSPSTSGSFLRQVEDLIAQQHNPASHIIARQRALAALTYCQAGYYTEAISLLVQCDAEALQIPITTYSNILLMLRSSSSTDQEHQHKISTVEQLYWKAIKLLVPAEDTASKLPQPLDNDHQLVTLVKSGLFQEAERLRSQLLEQGIALPMDHSFSIAARHVVRQSASVAERLRNFEHWFSLIPNSGQNTTYEAFRDLRITLLSAKVSNMPIITSFAWICADKGYSESVHSRVISAVAKHCSLDGSSAFLDEFLRRTKRFMASRYPSQDQYRVTKLILSLFVRKLCSLQRADEAVLWLRAHPEYHSVLPTRTYDIIARKLHDHLPADHTDLRFVYHVRGIKADNVNSPTLEEEMGANDSLASHLRLYRRRLSSTTDSTLQIHPSHAAQFIERYLASGRTRALTLLHKKALRASFHHGPPWIFAEMLYYLNNRMYELVVTTFVDYFHIVGLPRAEIMEKLQAWDIQNDTQSPLKVKAIPDAEHISVVWEAMIQLCQRRRSLLMLYFQFLYEIGQSKGEKRRETAFKSRKSWVNATPQIIGSNLEAPRPPPSQFSLTVFAKFVTTFTRRFNRVVAWRVIRRMMTHDAKLELAHVTVVLRALTQKGNHHLAIKLLDDMEAAFNGPLHSRMPPPNIVIYTCILRGCVNAQAWDTAEDVKRRMVRNLGYEQGMNSQTDDVIKLLCAGIERRNKPDIHVLGSSDPQTLVNSDVETTIGLQ